MSSDPLEIDCTVTQIALSVLRAADLPGEPSLYGALIHALVEHVDLARAQIEAALQAAGVQIRSIDVIAPSLEDVFIASVRE
jgi:hypothetical protein